MQRAQFIFESVGTRGDIEPLLNLATRVRAYGHECVLIAPRAFEAEAKASGLRFFASTERREATSGKHDLGLQDIYYPAHEAVVAAMLSLEASALPTVVVNIDRCCASNLVAERLGWPTLRLTLCPFKVRSLVSPPWPWGQHASGSIGKIYLKHTFPRLMHAADHDPRLLDHINGRRRSLDLPAITSASSPEPHVCAEVALFPAWFAAPASDWPERLELAGFAETNPSSALPAPLQAFLEREPAPLVFTTGTGEPDVKAFFLAARHCCEELGRPGVFLSSLAVADTGANPRLLALEFADLSALLPHASAFIHHGGVGGTARAFAAGVRQVISPLRFDQPDNARRVRELGAGVVLAREGLDGARLAGAIRQLEASATVGECTRRLRELALRERGIERCTRALLERVLPAAAASASAPVECNAATRRVAQQPPERRRRTVLMLVWPEPGHTAAPLTLAKQLRARGDRVIFAGLDLIKDNVVAQGFEFRALASLSKSTRGLPTSILWSWAAEAPLAAALEELTVRLDALLDDARPQLVLIDSLYSLLGGLVEGRAPWAIYETDLPREADPLVPPPHVNLVPDATAQTRTKLRAAWAHLLRETASRRAAAPPERGGWTLRTHFPDRLRRLIQARRGRRVPVYRNAEVAPVAAAPRLIFCPRRFDFQRSRTDNFHWVDPCVDLERAAAPFDWSLLPAGKRLIYCAQGTQSVRNDTATSVLRRVVSWIEQRSDLCMVLACSPQQRLLLSQIAPPNCIVMEHAPQLTVLSRASAAIVHGGFNTVKECVASGVPMLVVPLSHDQPRNAALVQAHGVGLAADAATLTALELERDVTRLLTEPSFREAAARFQGEFHEARGSALAVVDEWLAGARRPPATRSGPVRTCTIDSAAPNI